MSYNDGRMILGDVGGNRYGTINFGLRLDMASSVTTVAGLKTALAVPAAQIQADWNQATTTALDYIKNKPSIPSIPVASVFGRTGAVVAVSGDYTTTLVTENTNLYYTNTRARAALSAGANITYDNATGIIAAPRTSSVFSLPITATGATGVQVSSAKASTVRVTYRTQTTCTLAGNNSATVIVKLCATNSATETDWVAYGSTGGDQPSGISVVVGQVIGSTSQVCVDVPLGWWVKATQTIVGTASAAFVYGQQTIYG